MNFGDILKRTRLEVGMNQVELANKLNISKQTVSKYEKCEALPSLTTINDIANILDCSVDYLMGRTKNQKAAVIEQKIGADNVKIEMDKDYYKKLTPSDVQDILEKLQSVGFDLKKLI